MGLSLMSSDVANIIAPGRIRYGRHPFTIGVLVSPDNFMPIGQADCVMWDDHGLAVWMLRIDGLAIPGRWVIVDREFRPV